MPGLREGSAGTSVSIWWLPGARISHLESEFTSKSILVATYLVPQPFSCLLLEPAGRLVLWDLLYPQKDTIGAASVTAASWALVLGFRDTTTLSVSRAGVWTVLRVPLPWCCLSLSLPACPLHWISPVTLGSNLCLSVLYHIWDAGLTTQKCSRGSWPKCPLIGGCCICSEYPEEWAPYVTLAQNAQNGIKMGPSYLNHQTVEQLVWKSLGRMWENEWISLSMRVRVNEHCLLFAPLDTPANAASGKVSLLL